MRTQANNTGNGEKNNMRDSDNDNIITTNTHRMAGRLAGMRPNIMCSTAVTALARRSLQVAHLILLRTFNIDLCTAYFMCVCVRARTGDGQVWWVPPLKMAIYIVVRSLGRFDSLFSCLALFQSAMDSCFYFFFFNNIMVWRASVDILNGMMVNSPSTISLPF